jgi:hypothetical protein
MMPRPLIGSIAIAINGHGETNNDALVDAFLPLSRLLMMLVG